MAWYFVTAEAAKGGEQSDSQEVGSQNFRLLLVACTFPKNVLIF